MIIHLRADTPEEKVHALGERLEAIHIRQPERHVLVTSSKRQSLNGEALELEAYIEDTFAFGDDRQLAAKSYTGGRQRQVHISETLSVGGDAHETLMIGGPCSVESAEQLGEVAAFLADRGVKALRAGAYKPRTSPYSFQGLGLEGLKLLAQMRERYGFAIVTEVRDATHVDAVIEHADVVQIGTKAMYDQGVLRRCGKANKAVLIKRGFGSTLQECVQAAEFVLSGGNDKVMLCERGIRTFESKTRFTLDLCGVAWMKEHTNLPVIVDPSHAMGYRYGVPDLTRAAVAMGIEGLLIETHPQPDQALSDAAQQLDFEAFAALHDSLQAVASAVGRRMI
jgi:3-deoxy-7-phosphoheptulonate synthase